MPTNWVDRFAPAGLRPWLKLGRFDRPTGIWLLMLPGWQGIVLADAMEHRLPNLGLMGLVALGAALMRAAGCAYNDIVDRDIDAKVARTAMRPIPAGQISVRQAWGFVPNGRRLDVLVLSRDQAHFQLHQTSRRDAQRHFHEGSRMECSGQVRAGGVNASKHSKRRRVSWHNRLVGRSAVKRGS